VNDVDFDEFQDSAGTELLRRLPPVLRARDFHLYLEGGQRITDLWQLGGRAILGHKPPRVQGELKNAAERGLFAPFPHPTESRFFKALNRLFQPPNGGEPQFSFRLYASNASLEAGLEKAGFSGKAPLPLWRPFLENPLPPMFVPVLPWVFSPRVLVFEKSLESVFPPGDLIPPLILAPAARAIYDLINVLVAGGKDGGRPPYPRIKKALSREGSLWQRRGIYLYRNSGIPEDWEQLWMHFLENGFLLPPSPQKPLILPGMLSQGEETKLASLLGE
jgi:hypothetical protein